MRIDEGGVHNVFWSRVRLASFSSSALLISRPNPRQSCADRTITVRRNGATLFLILIRSQATWHSPCVIHHVGVRLATCGGLNEGRPEELG